MCGRVTNSPPHHAAVEASPLEYWFGINSDSFHPLHDYASLLKCCLQFHRRWLCLTSVRIGITKLVYSYASLLERCLGKCMTGFSADTSVHHHWSVTFEFLADELVQLCRRWNHRVALLRCITAVMLPWHVSWQSSSIAWVWITIEVLLSVALRLLPSTFYTSPLECCLVCSHHHFSVAWHTSCQVWAFVWMNFITTGVYFWSHRCWNSLNAITLK